MGVVWRNSDLKTLETRLRGLSGVALEAAQQIVEQTVSEGEAHQKQLLDSAITATGSSRGHGNSAGRNDTGQLINAIHSKSTTSSTQVSGQWGWFDDLGGNPVGKIDAQDFGGSPSHIPAAHSLLDSFVAQREVFIHRIRRLVGK